MELGGLGKGSFPNFCSRAPWYPHYHDSYGPAVLLQCHIAQAVTDLQTDLVPLLDTYQTVEGKDCWFVVTTWNPPRVRAASLATSTIFPSWCRLRRWRFYWGKLQLSKAHTLISECMSRNLFSPVRLRVQDFTSFGLFPDFSGQFLLSNDGTCDSDVKGSLPPAPDQETTPVTATARRMWHVPFTGLSSTGSSSAL